MRHHAAAEHPVVAVRASASDQERETSRGFLAAELGMIRTLWRRDLLRLRKERSRWVGVVLQPLLFWILIGSGFQGSFRMPGAEQVGYLEYFFPGILVMIVLFTTIFATISVIEDRQNGFLQGVLVAEGSRASMVLGKVAGVTTVALLQVALFLAVAPFAGFPLGSIAWAPLLVAVVLSCVGLTAVNMAVAWILSSAAAYHAIMSVALIPLWILSGAMFPAQGSWLSVVMVANPMTYSVAAVRAALAGGSASVAAPGLGTSLLALLGFAVVAMGLAVRVTRRPGGEVR